MTTALSIIQTAAGELGVPIGTTVLSTDQTMTRMRLLLNRAGKNLRRQHPWPECLKRYTFDLVEDIVEYYKPSDWDSWVNETFWNEDDSSKLIGPITPQEYEFIKNGVFISNADYKFRIQGISKNLKIVPTPTASDAGQTLVCEYSSKNWLRPATAWTSGNYTSGNYVYNGDNIYKAISSNEDSSETGPTHYVSFGYSEGTTFIWQAVAYEEILSDTDVVLLDEELLTLSLIWRFADSKGLTGETAKIEYDKLLRDRLGQTSGARTISLTGRGRPLWASREYNMPDEVI